MYHCINNPSIKNESARQCFEQYVAEMTDDEIASLDESKTVTLHGYGYDEENDVNILCEVRRINILEYVSSISTASMTDSRFDHLTKTYRDYIKSQCWIPPEFRTDGDQYLADCIKREQSSICRILQSMNTDSE